MFYLDKQQLELLQIPTHLEDVTQCTQFARYVVSQVGGVVVGYSIDLQNDSEDKIGYWCLGHDFAIVEGNYLIDLWARDVNCCLNRAVFDLQDPVDKALIEELYVSQDRWEVL